MNNLINKLPSLLLFYFLLLCHSCISLILFLINNSYNLYCLVLILYFLVMFNLFYIWNYMVYNSSFFKFLLFIFLNYLFLLLYDLLNLFFTLRHKKYWLILCSLGAAGVFVCMKEAERYSSYLINTRFRLPKNLG